MPLSNRNQPAPTAPAGLPYRDSLITREGRCYGFVGRIYGGNRLATAA